MWRPGLRPRMRSLYRFEKFCTFLPRRLSNCSRRVEQPIRAACFEQVNHARRASALGRSHRPPPGRPVGGHYLRDTDSSARPRYRRDLVTVSAPLIPMMCFLETGGARQVFLVRKRPWFRKNRSAFRTTFIGSPATAKMYGQGGMPQTVTAHACFDVTPRGRTASRRPKGICSGGDDAYRGLSHGLKGIRRLGSSGYAPSSPQKLGLGRG